MTNPLVTIVTPSYNQGQFIRATIDSVLGQDYTHLQYLVVDGGSIDDTVPVLKSYTDPRLTWVSERDRGQSDALNKGLRQAQGEIFTYINSDDTLLPGAIRFAVDYFSSHPEADLVYGDVMFIDAGSKILGEGKAQPFDIAQHAFHSQDILQPGAFWRMTVSERIGLFDETYHYAMDYDYWMRIALAGFRLDYAPGFRAAFRLHGVSKTVAHAMKFHADWQRILEHVYAQPELPKSVTDVRERAFAAADWWHAKNLWLNRQHDQARPLLRRFLHDAKRERRTLAAFMLIDSMLHTPFTLWMTDSYRRLTGKSIFR